MTATPITLQYRSALRIADQLGLNVEGFWEPTVYVIQHCLPPATKQDIKALIGLLIRLDLDSDWGTKFELKHMLQKANETDFTHALATRTVGRSHPLFFGILRINDLPWPKHIKASCIDEFVSLVHETTAPPDQFSKTEYYIDVYQARDVLICKYSDIHALKVHPQTRAQFSEKRARYEEVATRRRFTGGVGRRDKHLNTFWQSPPRLYGLRHEQKNNIVDEDTLNDVFSSDKLGLLSNQDQILVAKRMKLNWDRENLSSLSDQNHLSHAKVIDYINYLFTLKEHALAALALITYATGINPTRLYKIQITESPLNDINDVHYNLDTGLIQYGIINGATNFQKEKERPHKSQTVTLKLPTPFHAFLAKQVNQFKELKKKDYPLTSYARKNLGVRPTLSRIAKSSFCNLQLKNASRSTALLLKGAIPIQHQNEHAYYTSNNATVNDLFQTTLNRLLEETNFYKHTTASEKTESPIGTPAAITDYPIGSQLGDAGPFNFYQACSQSMSRMLVEPKSTQKQNSMQNLIATLNNLEVYYYFLLQFANAGRAVGPNTVHDLKSTYSIYRDKNSKHFNEKLFIPTSPLVRDQFKELEKLRAEVLRKTALGGIYYRYSGAANLAYIIEIDPERSNGTVAKLNALTALEHAAARWGIRFPFSRTNAVRHMTASYANSEFSETIANAWLNHCIDGYAPFSPRSSADVAEILQRLKQGQKDWLSKNGFKLILAEQLT